MMQLVQIQRNRRQSHAGYALMEVVMACALLGVFISVCLTAVVTSQVCTRKAKEDAIAMNFLTKYAENIKALPFTSIGAGVAINSVYNGASGAPLITIPANSSWVSVTNNSYLTFYPDLLWFNNRNPMMQVVLTQNSSNGVAHDIEINVKLDWDAPLAKGGRLEAQVDLLRTVNVPTL